MSRQRRSQIIREQFRFFGKNTLVKLLTQWLLIATGVGISAYLVDAISYDSTSDLVAAAVMLSLLNIFLKPILILFTLPFIVLTFGLGILIINSFLFILVSKIISGFHVNGYMAAFWGALIVSAISLISNALMRSSRKPQAPPSEQDNNKLKNDDIIDI